jgi:hypothetical protein
MKMKCFFNLFRRKSNTATTSVVKNINDDPTSSIDDKNAVKIAPAVSVTESTASKTTTLSTAAVSSEKACAVAKRYMDAYNNNPEQLHTILAPESYIQFDDGVEILASDVVDVVSSTRKSFPDFYFKYDTIVEISPGIVLIKNVQPSGTHTGEPYTFGPYEPIPATGIKVVNDPEDFYITVDIDTEQVTFFRSVAKGPKVGPHSVYEQIGGLII